MTTASRATPLFPCFHLIDLDLCLLMAANLPNNAVDLIRLALADLETRRARLASELVDLESEVKKHRTALSALTGEATQGRAVTKVQVRDELIALLRETPGQARPRDEIEGSGMGLAMVWKHVAVAGGRVWIDSAGGRGSRFHVIWPVQRAETQERAA